MFQSSRKYRTKSSGLPQSGWVEFGEDYVANLKSFPYFIILARAICDGEGGNAGGGYWDKEKIVLFGEIWRLLYWPDTGNLAILNLHFNPKCWNI